MNNLLIFFALPIATIIISIALQKILKCPPLVAAIIFAIFLIVTFIINNLNFLIAAIIYAIISFITAVIVCFICRILDRLDRRENHCRCRHRNDYDDMCRSDDNDFLTIDSDFQSNGNNGVFTINTLNSNDSSNNNNCRCNSCNSSSNSNNNRVSARINVIPNSDTNGRTGCLCGNYRRR